MLGSRGLAGELMLDQIQELSETNRQLLVDLAERMRVEQALRDREDQLLAIFENTFDAVIVLDRERNILDANRSALELFGKGKEELKTCRLDDFLPPESKAQFENDWSSFLNDGAQRGDGEIRRSDGSKRKVTFSRKANFLPGRHLVSLRDVTLRKQAEASLRALSHRLIRLQDEERRRISRELHDSTGQCLAALRMNLDVISRDAGKLGPEARKSLAEGLSLSNQCASDVRTISYLLHPPLLDEIGLEPALRWYVEGFGERSGIKVALDISDEIDGLPRDLGTTLFRIVQEALTNIHRHAESATARVRVSVANGKITLEIRDTGRGIDADALDRIQDGVQALGVGISGMRERVRQFGGELQIEPGKPGTVVRATFPLEVTNGRAATASCG